MGLGVELGAGELWTERDELAPGWDAHTPGARRSLMFFWHSTDPQVVDEESPLRLSGVTAAPIGSAYRPQDHLTTQAFESQVRTVRAIQERLTRPLDFAILTGDLADGGQKNELDWVMNIMVGGVIDPDTGKKDDPVPGPGNDHNDPYRSLGLEVPWYALVGNHEVLYSGIAEPTAEVQAAAVGEEVFQGLYHIMKLPPGEGVQGGFRDGTTEHGEVRTEGPTPADANRYIPDLNEVLSIFHGTPGLPEGHGLTAADVAAGKGYYSFLPVEGSPIRVIALNTLSQTPANAEGAIDEAQWTWLVAELDASAARGELVLLASHHKSADIKLGAYKGADLASLIARQEHVILHFTGHGHSNSVTHILPQAEQDEGFRGYWEVMTPSTIDFPLQTRFWELVDEGGGYLSIYGTLLDHNAPVGSLAHRARELAAGHGWFQSREQRATFDAEREHRNFILRVKVSDALSTALATAPSSDSIASEDTLAAF